MSWSSLGNPLLENDGTRSGVRNASAPFQLTLLLLARGVLMTIAAREASAARRDGPVLTAVRLCEWNSAGRAVGENFSFRPRGEWRDNPNLAATALCNELIDLTEKSGRAVVVGRVRVNAKGNESRQPVREHQGGEYEEGVPSLNLTLAERSASRKSRRRESDLEMSRYQQGAPSLMNPTGLAVVQKQRLDRMLPI